jgi:hypothetical protein
MERFRVRVADLTFVDEPPPEAAAVPQQPSFDAEEIGRGTQ